MSRIGKNPVEVPPGVEVRIDGNTVVAKGKLGEVSATLSDDVILVRQGNLIKVAPNGNSIRARKMWGTAKSVLDNLVTGVNEGFVRKLEINGVGYRAQIKGNELVLNLGYSHDVRYPIPDGLTITCSDQTHIEVFGADKQMVGRAASEIRDFRPPEPYKGKGVKYENEHILRKEGKKK
jgi:large subunit ribosomal protein L6